MQASNMYRKMRVNSRIHPPHFQDPEDLLPAPAHPKVADKQTMTGANPSVSRPDSMKPLCTLGGQHIISRLGHPRLLNGPSRHGTFDEARPLLLETSSPRPRAMRAQRCRRLPLPTTSRPRCKGGGPPPPRPPRLARRLRRLKRLGARRNAALALRRVASAGAPCWRRLGGAARARRWP